MPNIDRISLTRLQQLHPKVRDEAVRIFTEVSHALSGRAICRVTYALRTFQEQEALYQQGRSKPGRIVTNARGIPAQSYHCYGLALDFCLLYDEDGNGTYNKAIWDISKDFDGDRLADWMEVVYHFRKNGWESGGEWPKLKDWPHLQKVFGLGWRDLWRLVEQKKTDKQGYVLLK